MPDHHRADSTGCVYEHVIVAERKLGRKLKDCEVVHHIDFNRSNNSPENLMIFANNAEHTAYHKTNMAYQVGDVWFSKRKIHICKECGKQFTLTNYGQKYCSHECAQKARKKINVDVNIIINELKALDGNISAVARKHDVSYNCIVKILKRNNLPYHRADYQGSLA